MSVFRLRICVQLVMCTHRGVYRMHYLSSNHCLSTGGWACISAGLTEPDVECMRGYYCEYGVDTVTPQLGAANKGSGDICPAGSYCPARSSAPTAAPAGSYTATTGLYSYIVRP